VRRLFNLIEFVGKVSSFGARIVVEGLRTPFEGSQILTHIAEVGYKSLPLMAPAGFALGTVMTFHTRSTLVTFGASAMIPTVQALAVFVEIWPGSPRKPKRKSTSPLTVCFAKSNWRMTRTNYHPTCQAECENERGLLERSF
jgi:Permease MlaE